MQDTGLHSLVVGQLLYFYLVYLLYWYKSTITDAAGARHSVTANLATIAYLYSVYLLYWYESTITDAAGAQHSVTANLATIAVMPINRLLYHSVYLLHWYKSTAPNLATTG